MRPVAERVALGSLVLALGASLTTCRLDKLIKPAFADRLDVNPPAVVASANAGSIDAAKVTIRVASADGATLPWRATKTAAWVTLSPTSGDAPDSLVVTLRPDTLSETLHQDTIVFTSTQTNDTVRVPVTFDILPPAAKLSLSDTAHADTAFVRSAQPDTFSLRIKNTGALPLTWSAALDTGWVTLSDSGGTVPPQDTTSTIVLVTLRPESLSTGTHRGTITFAAPDAIGAPDTVSITYTIQLCGEPTVTPDTVVTGSVTLSDCGAPHKAGSQAKLYALQATATDTLSFRMTADFNAFLVVTNGAGDSLAASGECGAEVGTACITNFGVPAAGRYVVEATTEAAGNTGAFTLSVVKERAPSTPQSPGQFRGDSATAIGVGLTTTENVVVFKGTLNDPNPGDSVRLEIDLVGAISGPQIISSAFLPPGGAPVAVRATSLADNEAYHWRARTCDKTSRCSTWFSFGGNPETAADFFVNDLPQDPSLSAPGQFGPSGGAIAVGGGTGGTLGGSVTVTFKAVVTDFDPGDLISIEVQYNKVNVAFDGTGARGSGVSSGGTAEIAVSFDVPLVLTEAYHWRARACDQTNRCSGWVPFGGNADPGDTDFHVP